MKKFCSKEKEKLWLDKVPNNLILKVLKNKDEKKIKKNQKLFNSKLFIFIKNIKKYFPWKPFNLFAITIKRKLYNYSALIFLLIIYLIIWHPGFYNTYVPDTKEIEYSNFIISNDYNLYPPESVYLLIDIKNAWMKLVIDQKDIASFPVTFLPTLVKGKYKVSKFIKFEGNKVVILFKNKFSTFFLKQENIRLRASNYINIRYKYWKILIQYLKIGNFVIIK